MDYVDEAFLNSDAPQAEKDAYLESLAILEPFIDKWKENPLADHTALFEEMYAKMLGGQKTIEWNEELAANWKKIVDSDAEFTKRNDEEFLNSNAPAGIKELYLKCKAVGQPYLDKMNAKPLNFSENAALRAELLEKITSITREYSLRQDAVK